MNKTSLNDLNDFLEEILITSVEQDNICRSCLGSGYGDPYYSNGTFDYNSCSNCMGSGKADYNWEYYDRIDRYIGSI